MKLKTLQFYLLALSIFVIQQSASAQTKIGLRAGVTFSKLKIKDESDRKVNTQSVAGIQLAITADIPLMNNFYIQPGLSYADRGFKEDNSSIAYGSKFEYKASYVEVPVNILYKANLGTGNFLVGAGPYIGVGTGGSWKSDGQVIVQGDIVIEGKGDVIFRNDGFEGGNLESYNYGKPIDYGAGFLLGYEHSSGIFLQGNAQLGLANLQSRYGDFKPKGSRRNSSFGFTLGYKF